MSVNLEHHLQLLRSLDATHVCGFDHENSDEVEPLQCSPALQEIRLCCAHSAKKILYEAILALEDAGRLSSKRALHLKARISIQSMNLVRLDVSAAQEYAVRKETQTDPVPYLTPEHEIVTEQREVVRSLDAIRNELMQLCA